MLNKIVQFVYAKQKKTPDYTFLLYKLAKLHDVSEYDVFHESGEKISDPMVEAAFNNYIRDGSIPWWVKQHLDENREQINKHSLPYTILCIYP